MWYAICICHNGFEEACSAAVVWQSWKRREWESKKIIFPIAPALSQPSQILNCLKQESISVSCFWSPGDLSMPARERICFPPARMYHSHFAVQVVFYFILFFFRGKTYKLVCGLPGLNPWVETHRSTPVKADLLYKKLDAALRSTYQSPCALSAALVLCPRKHSLSLHLT